MGLNLVKITERELEKRVNVLGVTSNQEKESVRQISTGTLF